jgi:hypothetical protein
VILSGSGAAPELKSKVTAFAKAGLTNPAFCVTYTICVKYAPSRTAAAKSEIAVIATNTIFVSCGTEIHLSNFVNPRGQ